MQVAESLTGREAILLEELVGEPFAAIAEQLESDQVSMKLALALAYVVRRRTEPDLTWEQHLDDDIEVSFAALDEGEA